MFTHVNIHGRLFAMYQRSQEEILGRKKGKEKTEKKRKTKIKVAPELSGGKPEVLDTLMYRSLDCLIHVLLEITK